MTKYQSQVISAIVELLDMDDASQVGPDTLLEDDLGIDSGLLLELFMLLEERIPDMQIDPAELRPGQFTSIATFADMISACVVEGTPA